MTDHKRQPAKHAHQAESPRVYNRRTMIAGSGVVAGGIVADRIFHLTWPFNGSKPPSHPKSSQSHNTVKAPTVVTTPRMLGGLSMVYTCDQGGGDQAIWTHDFSTGKRMRHTSGANFYNPKVIPGDTSKVVATSDQSGFGGRDGQTTHLVEVDLASGSVSPITTGDHYWWDVNVLNDGRLIGKRAGTDDTGGSLYVMNRDGSDMQLVTGKLPSHLEAWAPQPIPGDPNSIILGIRDDNGNIRDQIAALDLNSGGFEYLTHGRTLDSRYPAVNATGDRIAYAYGADETGRQVPFTLRLMGINGEGDHQISPDVGLSFGDPAFIGHHALLAVGQNGNVPYSTYFLNGGQMALVDQPSSANYGDRGPEVFRTY